MVVKKSPVLVVVWVLSWSWSVHALKQLPGILWLRWCPPCSHLTSGPGGLLWEDKNLWNRGWRIQSKWYWIPDWSHGAEMHHLKWWVGFQADHRATEVWLQSFAHQRLRLCQDEKGETAWVHHQFQWRWNPHWPVHNQRSFFYTPAEGCYGILLFQELDQIINHRRFSGSTDWEISNTNNRKVERHWTDDIPIIQ